MEGPNTAPSCEITEPLDRSSGTLGEEILFTGVATDPDVSPAELSYVWRSDKDGELGSGSISSGGDVYFSYAGLSAATHAITLEVSDEVGENCSDIIFLTIGTAPTINIAAPLSGDLYEVGEHLFRCHGDRQ